jgi:hypothetical protein
LFSGKIDPHRYAYSQRFPGSYPSYRRVTRDVALNPIGQYSAFAMLRRLLSTRPHAPAGKVARASAAKAGAAVEQVKLQVDVEDAKANPWGHFSAFRSMEDYVDATLIQYHEEDENEGDKSKA